jgi:hypothetical protein
MEEYKRKNPKLLQEWGLNFFKTIFKNHNLKYFQIEIAIQKQALLSFSVIVVAHRSNIGIISQM